MKTRRRERPKAGIAARLALTVALAASMLPMSFGIMSWSTVGCALGRLWPLVLLAAALFAVGLYRGNDALLLVSAFLFVAFCVLGVTFCVIPGEIESLLFYGPTGHPIKITVAG